jgi:hypothetical protein
MHKELKTVEFECDLCHRKIVIQAVNSAVHDMLPNGWTYKEEKNCGMTGYTRYDEYCQSCSKKYNFDSYTEKKIK